jgi:hypothetical protein
MSPLLAPMRPIEGGGADARARLLPADLAAVAHTFAEGKSRWGQAVDDVVRVLAGSGGMAGGDEPGTAFATAYDPVAVGGLTTLAACTASLGGVAEGLLMSAANLARADGQPVQGSFRPVDVPPTPTPPSAGGGAAADRGLPGKLAEYWPAGDPGRLRTAGDAWRRISATSQDLQAGLHAAIRSLTGANTGRAVERIEAFWERLRAVLQIAADGADAAAKACDDYARYVDDVRGEILSIAAEVVAISAAGLLLTALTVGASDEVAIAADAALIAEATADLGRLTEFAHLVAVPLVKSVPTLYSAASKAPAVIVTAAEAESAGDLAALESAHVDALAGVPAHAWPTISGIVRSATQGKGNFGLGSATRAEAEAAGQSLGRRHAAPGKRWEDSRE